MDFSTADLTTSGGMATVAVLFAVFGFLRGLVKFVFSLVALAIGVFAAFWGFRNGDSIAAKVIETPEPWMSYGVAIIVGLGVHSIARSILNFLSGSFNNTAAGRKLGFGAPAGVLGLLMGVVFSGLGLSGLKHIGSASELEHLNNHIHQQAELSEKPPLFMRLKQMIDESKPGQWHDKVDPFNDKASLNLAKLFVLRQSDYHAARAVTSDSTRRVLGQPDVTQLLVSGDDTAQLAAEGKFLSLLNSHEIKKISQIPAAEKALLSTNIEQALGLK